MPVRFGMAVSGCSTTTQSASAQRHRRKSATPQKVRPSRRFWCACALSLRVWCVQGGQANTRLHLRMFRRGVKSPT
eukprot:1396076-Pleurochrysis_carterae.AAC.1